MRKKQSVRLQKRERLEKEAEAADKKSEKKSKKRQPKNSKPKQSEADGAAEPLVDEISPLDT